MGEAGGEAVLQGQLIHKYIAVEQIVYQGGGMETLTLVIVFQAEGRVHLKNVALKSLCNTTTNSSVHTPFYSNWFVYNY